MKKIFALMAAALSLAACSTNDVADITQDDAYNVVNVASVTRSTADGSNTSPMSAPFHLVNTTQQTVYRANYEADFEAILNEDDNVSGYTISRGKIVWCNKKSDGERMDNVFEAFSPLKTGFNNASYSTFNLPTYQASQDLLQSADWMTATTTIKKDEATDGLALNFSHRNAKLHFDVYAKADAIAMQSEDFNVLGSITPYYNNTSTPTTIEAIVEPRDDAYTTNDELINITLGNETFSLKFPREITFAPGKQYNFNLNLGHDAVSISSVSVSDWDSATITTNDDQAFNDSGIDYVTFTADSEQGFKFVVTTEDPEYQVLLPIEGFEYSVNNGPWIAIPGTGMNDFVTFGGDKGKLRLRGKSTDNTGTRRDGESSSHGHATVTFSDENVKVDCSGDIRTLIDYENHFVATNNARFSYLFDGCTQLKSAPKLPATDLADRCYYRMFYGCTSLATAPELPATTLASWCYCYMFSGCKSLATAPEELPATELASYCYYQMFIDCESLISAPKLPATELASYCYFQMFKGCTSLTTAPELPATTLAYSCYESMFYRCTSLTKAPELPAQTLYSNCYKEIFSGCKKISEIKMLAPSLQISTDNMDGWLNYVGTDELVKSRKLILDSQAAYNALTNYNNKLLPDEWKATTTGATVKDKDGNAITEPSDD